MSEVNIFSKKTVVIISALTVVLIIATTIGYFLLMEKPYCETNNTSIKSEFKNKAGIIANYHRITEETTKNYSLGGKFNLTNTFIKSCYIALKSSEFGANIFSTLKYDNIVVGEFNTYVIGDDMSRIENSSFEKLDKMKDSQIYKTEGLVDSQQIKLVGDSIKFSSDKDSKENEPVFIIKEVDGALDYNLTRKLEWKSSDDGKTWKFYGS